MSMTNRFGITLNNTSRQKEEEEKDWGALVGVVQWIECRPVDGRVAGVPAHAWIEGQVPSCGYVRGN